MGVAQLIWLPCLASSKCTLVGYIEIDKTNKLGIQAKVQFQDVGVAQLFFMPRPLEKILCTGGRFSCILHTVSYIRNLLNAFALTAVICQKSEVIG